MAFPLFLVLYRSQMTFLGLNGKIMEKAFLNEGLSQAKLCVGGCKALRWRLQSFASETGKTGIEIVSPILDKRKGKKDLPHGPL